MMNKFSKKIINQIDRKMKRITLIMIAVLMAFSSYAAGDILTLNNGKKFEVKVKRIKDCSVICKARGQKFEIPASDIFSLQFENTTDKVYIRYLKMLDQNPDLCMQGKLDAKNYHGKKGVHVVLGFLFGPFAMLGTALANPSPYNGKRTQLMSKNKDHFSNLEYLSCYKKTAKNQLIKMEATGWASSIVLSFSIMLTVILLFN